MSAETEKESEKRQRQSAFQDFLFKVRGSLLPRKGPELDHKDSCYRRCENCNRCLSWRESNGEVKQVLTHPVYFLDEKVRNLCPFCKKCTTKYGVDPDAKRRR